jgi:hypothetical protein
MTLVVRLESICRKKEGHLPLLPTKKKKNRINVLLNYSLVALRLGCGLMLEADMKMRRIMEQLTFWNIWLLRQVVRLIL